MCVCVCGCVCMCVMAMKSEFRDEQKVTLGFFFFFKNVCVEKKMLMRMCIFVVGWWESL